MSENFLVTKIYLPVVLFLLSIFPWSPSLIGLSQSLLYPGEQKITDAIVEMIKTDNVDEVYELMADYTKQSHPELKEELHELVAYIDGDVTSYKYSRSSSHSCSDDAWQNFSVEISTESQKYEIPLTYIKKYIKRPDYVGVKSIFLLQRYGKYSYEHLYSIRGWVGIFEAERIVGDAIKNNDPGAIVEASSIKLREKFPDLEEQFGNMINMVEGSYVTYRTESFEEDRINLDLYGVYVMTYETDKGIYSITIKDIDWLSTGKFDGILGITLSKINDDGTCEELFSVIDEETWYHDFVNAP